MAAQRRWKGLGSGEESGYARTHFSKGIEYAVKDYEKGKDGLDGPDCAAKDEAEDAPAEEAKSHCLLTAYAVHEEATDHATGKIEAIHHGLARRYLAIVKYFLASEYSGRERGRASLPHSLYFLSMYCLD